MPPRFAIVPARWLAADSGLDKHDRLVLCVMCQWVNQSTGECFPSLPTIAAHAGISENSVRSALKRLEELGAMQVERRVIDEQLHTSNLYTIFGYDPPRKKAESEPRMTPEKPPELNPITPSENRTVRVGGGEGGVVHAVQGGGSPHAPPPPAHGEPGVVQGVNPNVFKELKPLRANSAPTGVGSAGAAPPSGANDEPIPKSKRIQAPRVIPVVKFPGTVASYPPPEPLPETQEVTAEQWEETKKMLLEIGVGPPVPKPHPMPDPLDKSDATVVSETTTPENQERSA